MSKKTLNIAGIVNELEGASMFFQPAKPPPEPPQPPPSSPSPVQRKPIPKTVGVSPEGLELAETGAGLEHQQTSEQANKEVKKFTSKLVTIPSDPPVNKVGFYFTRREIDLLDDLVKRLKPILRDQYMLRVTKNEIIRACLAIGMEDWEENQLAGKLANLLTSK